MLMGTVIPRNKGFGESPRGRGFVGSPLRWSMEACRVGDEYAMDARGGGGGSSSRSDDHLGVMIFAAVQNWRTEKARLWEI